MAAARKPAPSRSRKPAPVRRAPAARTSDRERLATIETTLYAALEALPDKIALAVRDAVSDLAAKHEVQAVEDRVTNAIGALSEKFDALAEKVGKLSESRAAGDAAQVVKAGVQRSLHDWAQTLLPHALPLVAWVFVAAKATGA